MCDLEVIKKVRAYRELGKYRLGDFTREELLAIARVYAADALHNLKLREMTGFIKDAEVLINANVILQSIAICQGKIKNSEDYVTFDNIRSEILKFFLPYIIRLLCCSNKESEQ